MCVCASTLFHITRNDRSDGQIEVIINVVIDKPCEKYESLHIKSKKRDILTSNIVYDFLINFVMELNVKLKSKLLSIQ